MKILVPLNNLDHIHDFMDAGADEFYIGFYDEAWNNKFGDFHDINRMSGFKEMANTYTFEALLQCIKKMKEYNKELYITFNSSIYSQEQLNYIEKYFQKLKQAQVDGVIVSTIELVQLAKQYGLYSVISTIAGIYNTDMVDVYVKHGANRIILPRDLSLGEIKTITHKRENIEYEVFMMRNGCSFSDSNCLGLHRKEICSICSGLKKSRNIYHMSNNDFHTKQNMDLNNNLFRHYFHNFSCGLCSIYEFIEAGITTCKIVGRYDEWREVCEDIRMVKENIKIAKECKSQEEYLESMNMPKRQNEMCKMGLSCYYPEIRY